MVQSYARLLKFQKVLKILKQSRLRTIVAMGYLPPAAECLRHWFLDTEHTDFTD